MKATIIIPTRNRLELLMTRCLPSVKKQTYKDFEIIVIDDASEEEYPNLIYNPMIEIRIYKNSKRMGLAYNRNLGAEMAYGEYIVHLDDDNELHPDFLKETIDYIENYGDSDGKPFDAIAVGKNVIYPEGKVYQPPPEGSYFSMNDGFLIRREAFLDIKCDETLTANEDADFGLRFLKKYKVGRIDEPLMTSYASAIINKTSYSDYSDYHLKGLVKFWLKNKNEFDKENGDYYKKMIGRMFLLAAGRPKWFKPMYWLEEKLKRYYQIWKR